MSGWRQFWTLTLTIAVAAVVALGSLALVDALLGLREPLLFSVVAIPAVALVAALVSGAVRHWLGPD